MPELNIADIQEILTSHELSADKALSISTSDAMLVFEWQAPDHTIIINQSNLLAMFDWIVADRPIRLNDSSLMLVFDVPFSFYELQKVVDFLVSPFVAFD